MKKVLFVTPRFPPTNAADHHRVRMALPYLQEYGWDAHVLTVDPVFVPNERDDLLEQTLPSAVKRTTVTPFSERWTRKIGLGSLGLRCYRAMQKAGHQMLADGSFDLVFFSTTEFVLFSLGPLWRRDCNVPYVVDFQDPWLTDYYEKSGAPPPPGGRLKYRFHKLLAQWLEPKVMRQAAKTVCVSPAYPKMLQARYPYLPDDHFATIPFGVAEADFDVAGKLPLADGLACLLGKGRNWCYIGVVTDSMQFALRAFFAAFCQAKEKFPGRFDEVKLLFIGTDYAPSGRSRKRVLPIAVEFGLGEIVVEQTDRIPYFSALRLMLAADALIIPGTDDPGYTASKIYPCIVAQKPLLTVFHQESSVVDVMRKTKAGVNVSFAGTTPTDLTVCSTQIVRQWFEVNCDRTPDTDWVAFEPYTAREMTRRLCAVFDAALAATH